MSLLLLFRPRSWWYGGDIPDRRTALEHYETEIQAHIEERQKERPKPTKKRLTEAVTVIKAKTEDNTGLSFFDDLRGSSDLLKRIYELSDALNDAKESLAKQQRDLAAQRLQDLIRMWARLIYEDEVLLILLL